MEVQAIRLLSYSLFEFYDERIISNTNQQRTYGFFMSMISLTRESDVRIWTQEKPY